MNHATVKIGEYTIPLIGIEEDATQQQCSQCKQSFHLSEIKLDQSGEPWCEGCQIKRLKDDAAYNKDGL